MINEILEYAVKNNCSDVHLSSGNYPSVRKKGDLFALKEYGILTKEAIKDGLDGLMEEKQKEFYRKNLEIDFALKTKNGNRFRVNAFRMINGPAAVFRIVENKIKTLSEIGAPQTISDLTRLNKGLVLFTGPTGCGKSTTLAAIIDFINENYNRNIITIEDPIEYVHKQKKSLIVQREIGNDTLSFANALKSSLRQDPDVILVGEMRDLETIQLALTAAETGHLVFATIHTNSAAKAISRIIDVFAPEDKATIRTMLASSLTAVISQRLLKTVNSDLRAVFEILIANSSVRNLIKEGQLLQIQSIMELHKKQGMLTLKDSIIDLMNRGIISQQEAHEALFSCD